MNSTAEERTIDELVSYSRLCYERRLVGAAGGNVSVRIPGGDRIAMTASGVALRDVSPENVLIVDGQGAVLRSVPGLRPSKEMGFHLTVYRERPQVQAVIHVHPTYPLLFAMRQQTIPLVTISAQLKLKQGEVVASAPPGSVQLAEAFRAAIVRSAPEATVFLMADHGLVAAGQSLCAAFDDAELASDTAQIAYLSSVWGSQSSAGPYLGECIDLTAPLDEHIHFYPTDPAFKMSWHALFASGGVNVSKVELGLHTGTHVDAPLHMLDHAASIDSMPPRLFAGPAVAFDVPKAPGQNVLPDDVPADTVRPGHIVLFRTGWDRRASTPAFFEDEWPGLDPRTVDKLAGLGVKAIGGDIASADSPAGIRAGFVAHRKALALGLPIFEGLVKLERVVGREFFFVGLPLLIVGGEASPIRAVAILGR